jgi:hypothetical protein
MNLKRAEALEQERETYCTRGTINRWFDEFSGLDAGVNPRMLWNMDEVMVAASRDGLVHTRRTRDCWTGGARRPLT